MVEHYESTGMVYRIDASGDVDAVFAAVCTTIDQHIIVADKQEGGEEQDTTEG